jgi:hypothetical protein
MSDFVSFGKIQQVGKLYMTITQKIHGSNAQIFIWEDENGINLKTGSRTRWITPEDDNFGFAKFVYGNATEIIQTLGLGRHYGEWAGPGINAGEGLAEKNLFLFDWKRWKDKELPKNISTVPVLYSGKYDISEIDFQMSILKQDGSRACPGYMKPEGVVVSIDRNFYKKTFDAEEIAWKKTDKKQQIVISGLEVDYLLQPLRLEKLLSRDERYLRDYPRTLPDIIRDYVKDLNDEGEILGNSDECKAVEKALGKKVFGFVKTFIGGINEQKPI